ncbi:Gfo/Idh/MocA family protein [Hoeflea sp.]|uniref:Gfo/Idh/MocA family protein n=1 Tax=Hoeflea sp. TaxID=1940281 RepID=UPI003A9477CF
MAIEGSNTSSSRRIRLGMVGGGRDAFIGGVHRIASRIDDRYELVAGAFSSTPEKSKASAADLGVAEDRAYGDYVEMAKREARLKNGIEAVSIVTPNHMHFPVAREFLKRGIHVICDKPLTSTLADARKLAKVAEASGALFVLTHNYTGYPMMRQAREMIAGGELGKIRLVQVEYAQDWLSEKLEKTGQKQAGWRTDPARSGLGGSTGDIGTHAFNLASFVSGLELEQLCADLDSFVEGRQLDDNGHVLMRFSGGAKGMLWCSQVAPGNENALKLRIYGEKGGLEWAQEDPNYLWHTPLGQPKRLLTRNGAGATAAGQRVSRIPGGHPEGYLEGFANIYTEAAETIIAHRDGKPVPDGVMFPGINEGLAGVAFVTACVESSKRGAAWVKFDTYMKR